jgi:ankyrin repeat protein
MLTWAIECGYKRLARFIVVNNDQFDGNPRVALDKGDYQGHFPIDATLESSEVELLRLLITHGSNPVAAFQRALSSDNFYVIRLLINETSMRRLGGFWEKEEDMLFNIHCFAYDCKNDLLKRLLKKYHQTLSGQKDITPAVKAAIFHLAVFLEGIEVVQKIFDSGFELDRTDRSIVHATEKGNLELVMLLILHRADPALRSKNGTNLLFKAVQMSRYESESTN